MTGLQTILDGPVGIGALAGAVALVARGDEVEVAVAGRLAADQPAPMARDTIVRAASITKPIVAAAVLMLVEDGQIALDESVDGWLPELAAPLVLRTLHSPLDDVVAADRDITVEDLLISCVGYGFADDFTLPGVAPLFEYVQADGRQPQLLGPPLLPPGGPGRAGARGSARWQLEPAAGVPFRRGRSGVDRRRLARLRSDAARRGSGTWSPAARTGVGRADDDQPPDQRSA